MYPPPPPAFPADPHPLRHGGVTRRRRHARRKPCPAAPQRGRVACLAVRYCPYYTILDAPLSRPIAAAIPVLPTAKAGGLLGV